MSVKNIRCLDRLLEIQTEKIIVASFHRSAILHVKAYKFETQHLSAYASNCVLLRKSVFSEKQ